MRYYTIHGQQRCNITRADCISQSFSSASTRRHDDDGDDYTDVYDHDGGDHTDVLMIKTIFSADGATGILLQHQQGLVTQLQPLEIFFGTIMEDNVIFVILSKKG